MLRWLWTVDGDVSPTASPISRTDGGYPRSLHLGLDELEDLLLAGADRLVGHAHIVRAFGAGVKHLFAGHVFDLLDGVDVERLFGYNCSPYGCSVRTATRTFAVGSADRSNSIRRHRIDRPSHAPSSSTSRCSRDSTIARSAPAIGIRCAASQFADGRRCRRRGRPHGRRGDLSSPAGGRRHDPGRLRGGRDGGRPTMCWPAPVAYLPPPPRASRHTSARRSRPGRATRCGRSPQSTTATIAIATLRRRAGRPQRWRLDPGRPADRPALTVRDAARRGASRAVDVAAGDSRSPSAR